MKRQNISDMCDSAESSLYSYLGYNLRYGECPDYDTISDLISDLLHLADQEKLDWEKVMRVSMNKFIGEKFGLGFGYRGILNPEDK